MPDPSMSPPPENRLKPLPNRVARLIAPIIPFVVIGVMAALVAAYLPRFRSALFQLPFLLAPLFVVASFQYIRILRPGRVSPILAKDSPQILKLRRIKRILGWATPIFLFLPAAILFITDCGCEHHPVLTMLAFVPCYGALFGHLCLKQYIIERTKDLTPPVAINRWPGRKLSPSELKPFHWGTY